MDVLKFIIVNLLLILSMGFVFTLPLSLGANNVTVIVAFLGLLFIVFNIKTIFDF